MNIERRSSNFAQFSDDIRHDLAEVMSDLHELT